MIGVAYPAINDTTLYGGIVSLPPLVEQKRIVNRIEELLPFVNEYDKAEQELTALDNEFSEKLKKSVLQAAVQGKLVPQDPNDEPASVLVERIRSQRKKLIHEGKIKPPKNESVIFRRDNSHYEKRGGTETRIDDELPFEIPETWAWVRLGNVVYNHGQITPTEDFCYIDIGSIDNQRQQLNEQENIVTASKAPSRARKIVKLNDILYSTVRPYLHNMCIVDREFSHIPIASTGFALMACYQGLNNQYLFDYLLSPIFYSYANDIENSKGVAYPAINDTRFYNALVPLPPYAEQARIAIRVEELLSAIQKM
jgi:type I restriction enzyme S subunit